MKNKLKITDNEILFIFRKFDKDQDGKISLKEFENEMKMLGFNRKTTINLNNSHISYKSPMKNSIKSAGKSSVKSSIQKSSKKQKEFPLEKSPETFKYTEKDQKCLENSINSIKESLSRSRISPSDDFKPKSLESPERVSVSKRRLYKNYQFNQEDSDEKLNRESPLREIEEKIQRQSGLQSQFHANNSQITGNFGSNMKKSAEKAVFFDRKPEKSGFSDRKPEKSSFSDKKVSFSNERGFYGTFGSSHQNSSEMKKSLRKYESPLRKTFVLNEFDEKELVRTLKLQIDLDREIEATKNELSLQGDFNLLEAFKSFDEKGNGSLTLFELQRAFARLDVHLSEDESYVFLKRFDKTLENVLRYSDFCDIFTPRAEEYHHILASRTPSIKNQVFFF